MKTQEKPKSPLSSTDLLTEIGKGLKSKAVNFLRAIESDPSYMEKVELATIALKNGKSLSFINNQIFPGTDVVGISRENLIKMFEITGTISNNFTPAGKFYDFVKSFPKGADIYLSPKYLEKWIFFYDEFEKTPGAKLRGKVNQVKAKVSEMKTGISEFVGINAQKALEALDPRQLIKTKTGRFVIGAVEVLGLSFGFNPVALSQEAAGVVPNGDPAVTVVSNSKPSVPDFVRVGEIPSKGTIPRLNRDRDVRATGRQSSEKVQPKASVADSVRILNSTQPEPTSTAPESVTPQQSVPVQPDLTVNNQSQLSFTQVPQASNSERSTTFAPSRPADSVQTNPATTAETPRTNATSEPSVSLTQPASQSTFSFQPDGNAGQFNVPNNPGSPTFRLTPLTGEALDANSAAQNTIPLNDIHPAFSLTLSNSPELSITTIPPVLPDGATTSAAEAYQQLRDTGEAVLVIPSSVVVESDSGRLTLSNQVSVNQSIHRVISIGQFEDQNGVLVDVVRVNNINNSNVQVLAKRSDGTFHIIDPGSRLVIRNVFAMQGADGNTSFSTQDLSPSIVSALLSGEPVTQQTLQTAIAVDGRLPDQSIVLTRQQIESQMPTSIDDLYSPGGLLFTLENSQLVTNNAGDSRATSSMRDLFLTGLNSRDGVASNPEILASVLAQAEFIVQNQSEIVSRYSSSIERIQELRNLATAGREGGRAGQEARNQLNAAGVTLNADGSVNTQSLGWQRANSESQSARRAAEFALQLGDIKNNSLDGGSFTELTTPHSRFEVAALSGAGYNSVGGAVQTSRLAARLASQEFLRRNMGEIGGDDGRTPNETGRQRFTRYAQIAVNIDRMELTQLNNELNSNFSTREEAVNEFYVIWQKAAQRAGLDTSSIGGERATVLSAFGLFNIAEIRTNSEYRTDAINQIISYGRRAQLQEQFVGAFGSQNRNETSHTTTFDVGAFLSGVFTGGINLKAETANHLSQVIIANGYIPSEEEGGFGLAEDDLRDLIAAELESNGNDSNVAHDIASQALDLYSTYSSVADIARIVGLNLPTGIPIDIGGLNLQIFALVTSNTINTETVTQFTSEASPQSLREIGQRLEEARQSNSQAEGLASVMSEQAIEGISRAIAFDQNGSYQALRDAATGLQIIMADGSTMVVSNENFDRIYASLQAYNTVRLQINNQTRTGVSGAIGITISPQMNRLLSRVFVNGVEISTEDLRDNPIEVRSAVEARRLRLQADLDTYGFEGTLRHRATQAGVPDYVYERYLAIAMSNRGNTANVNLGDTDLGDGYVLRIERSPGGVAVQATIGGIASVMLYNPGEVTINRLIRISTGEDSKDTEETILSSNTDCVNDTEEIELTPEMIRAFPVCIGCMVRPGVQLDVDSLASGMLDVATQSDLGGLVGMAGLGNLAQQSQENNIVRSTLRRYVIEIYNTATNPDGTINQEKLQQYINANRVVLSQISEPAQFDEDGNIVRPSRTYENALREIANNPSILALTINSLDITSAIALVNDLDTRSLFNFSATKIFEEASIQIQNAVTQRLFQSSTTGWIQGIIPQNIADAAGRSELGGQEGFYRQDSSKTVVVRERTETTTRAPIGFSARFEELTQELSVLVGIDELRGYDPDEICRLILLNREFINVSQADERYIISFAGEQPAQSKTETTRNQRSDEDVDVRVRPQNVPEPTPPPTEVIGSDVVIPAPGETPPGVIVPAPGADYSPTDIDGINPVQPGTAETVPGSAIPNQVPANPGDVVGTPQPISPVPPAIPITPVTPNQPGGTPDTNLGGGTIPASPVPPAIPTNPQLPATDTSNIGGVSGTNPIPSAPSAKAPGGGFTPSSGSDIPIPLPNSNFTDPFNGNFSPPDPSVEGLTQLTPEVNDPFTPISSPDPSPSSPKVINGVQTPVFVSNNGKVVIGSSEALRAPDIGDTAYRNPDGSVKKSS